MSGPVLEDGICVPYPVLRELCMSASTKQPMQSLFSEATRIGQFLAGTQIPYARAGKVGTVFWY